MGKVTVQNFTIKNPISIAGYESGVCYGSDTSDNNKNYQRGLNNFKNGHWRTMEFGQIYLTLEGYSARVIRELYTHIAGGPTRLQASTRYIDYSADNGFDFIIPPSIAKDKTACHLYKKEMKRINNLCQCLEEDFGVPKEDTANLLPLGMTTTIVLRTNLRNLIDMCHQRLCSKAYWEFRQLMMDILKALSLYSPEWSYVIDTYAVPKCEYIGYCNESKSCGRKNNLQN